MIVFSWARVQEPGELRGAAQRLLESRASSGFVSNEPIRIVQHLTQRNQSISDAVSGVWLCLCWAPLPWVRRG